MTSSLPFFELTFCSKTSTLGPLITVDPSSILCCVAYTDPQTTQSKAALIKFDIMNLLFILNNPYDDILDAKIQR
ncbi:hypothetical protein SVI_3589 [Shewanella violacea DSS12]|uniref:Uncharacterized protein n=1 Tax=Shewanella violacea (strain JCM 10179 / CIP 106290 / LMG 19151 / DSS12) TaxID=637905 RepID=D4ZC15_SHEVD|nr:hypothetical protein SVI_3589 [Shewanella violacea DSS12]